jgi:glycosyltransferase involved in cell wall biosynthesis
MRITFISPTVNMGGGTKVVVIYAQQLMRMGHSVRIISPPPRIPPLFEKFRSLLRGTGWPGDPPTPKSYPMGNGVHHHVLDRWRPVVDDDVPEGDVVIATWWETAEWVNALDPSKGAKVYFIQHHEVFPYLPVAECHATYRLPLHKIVIARWLKHVMSAQYADNVVDVVPNSVDRAQFFAAVRGKQLLPTVGFLYSTVPFKGLDASLAALRIVRERIPNLRVISFGSEPPRPDLALPTGAEFFFCPPQDEIRNLYSRCDVWLTGSRSEGFNLPALEAMACRTPVVSTRTGWPQEVLKSGRNGVLVNVDDRIGLAQGLQWVLSRSDQDWRNLSANAYAIAASGSWEASAQMFEKALEHACRRSARGEIAGKANMPSPLSAGVAVVPPKLNPSGDVASSPLAARRGAPIVVPHCSPAATGLK